MAEQAAQQPTAARPLELLGAGLGDPSRVPSVSSTVSRVSSTVPVTVPTGSASTSSTVPVTVPTGSLTTPVTVPFGSSGTWPTTFDPEPVAGAAAAPVAVGQSAGCSAPDSCVSGAS